MKKFMDSEFLLNNKTAQRLYHSYAENTPIVDYHCHIIPEQIANNMQFENITKIWLGGDHYKWRLMRANGVDESYITGEASDRDKFQKWAETLDMTFGNPIYHWSHLELQRYFGYEGVLTGKTAGDVWDLANEKLAKEDMKARALIRNSNVKLICTTDDPADTLEWHKVIADNREAGDAVVFPAFRPDKAVVIERPEFLSYIEQLGKSANKEISSFQILTDVLQSRIDLFSSMGCRAADHGIDYVPFIETTPEEANQILQKKLTGKDISAEEALKYKTAVLLFLGEAYHKADWAMQLHFSCRRNVNSRMFVKLGPDTGFDCMSTDFSIAMLTQFLNALEVKDALPKTILYSLNPNDNAIIDSVINCFQGKGIVGKIQHGAAWWFNDHKCGMKEQMLSLASIGLFGSFIGMLTDSRSFLSYPRHEYFRRLLCDMLGEWVETGECPDDEELLAKYVKNISYNNAVKYFGLPLETV